MVPVIISNNDGIERWAQRHDRFWEHHFISDSQETRLRRPIPNMGRAPQYLLIWMNLQPIEERSVCSGDHHPSAIRNCAHIGPRKRVNKRIRGGSGNNIFNGAVCG